MKIYLAHNIKTLRKAHYMSQAELGKKLGLTRSSICSLEKSVSTTKFSTLLKIRELFGVDLETLVFHRIEFEIKIKKNERIS